MHISKEYIHDRIILLLLSASIFVTILNSLLILLRLDNSRGRYIVQYRDNLGISGYKAGDSSTFLSFVAFGVIILVLQVLLSNKAFKIHRQYAIVISALSLFLLVLTIVVSNALLTLR